MKFSEKLTKAMERNKKEENYPDIHKMTDGYTHGATFHADDVFATAFIQKINPDIQIHRVFRVPEELPETALVYDIGKGTFDHHQADNEIRLNGVPYAAFGKLFRAYGSELGLTKKSLDEIEKNFVEPIDEADNGGKTNPLTFMIGSFNPNWNEESNYDAKFFEAVEVAKLCLDKEIERVKAVEQATNIVMEAASKMENGVVVLDQYAPQDALQDVPEAKFVVFPSNRGGYNIQTVPTKEDSMKGRVPFSEEWLGNPDQSLGMTFCHPGNFMASADTLENAINIANIAVEKGLEREAEADSQSNDELETDIDEEETSLD